MAPSAARLPRAHAGFDIQTGVERTMDGALSTDAKNICLVCHLKSKKQMLSPGVPLRRLTRSVEGDEGATGSGRIHPVAGFMTGKTAVALPTQTGHAGDAGYRTLIN